MRQGAFLAAFAETARISSAAKCAGVTRQQHYEWMKEPEYAAKFAEASSQAGDTLQDEAVRRAHDGVEEPVIYQGELCYSVREKKDENGQPILSDLTGQPLFERDLSRPLSITRYSDGLMQFLLRGFSPEKYRERTSVDVSGSIDIDITERLNAARQRLKKKGE